MTFVLLQHDPPAAAPGEPTAFPTHWDFMLETSPDGPLATWRFGEDPTARVGPIEAERIDDHRRVYLDYEGEVSGGRGRVRRADKGPAVVIEARTGHVLIELSGNLLRGRFAIDTDDAGRGVFRPA
ncbi:MAG: hypothetical protein IPM13_13235 [Phycisphaerales bacterium]|nr:hypothetical protein [Phycisphaerales bacterium]